MEINDQAEAVRNNYRRQGAKAEQERIIKLLENHTFMTWQEYFKHEKQCLTCQSWDGIAAAIALIKGEQE